MTRATSTGAYQVRSGSYTAVVTRMSGSGRLFLPSRAVISRSAPNPAGAACRRAFGGHGFLQALQGSGGQGLDPGSVPRPQAGLSYTPGDTLVLYTDGLVERHDEDIDASLARLTSALSRGSTLDPNQLADDLLARLGVASGARDDIALVVIRL